MTGILLPGRRGMPYHIHINCRVRSFYIIDGRLTAGKPRQQKEAVSIGEKAAGRIFIAYRTGAGSNPAPRACAAECRCFSGPEDGAAAGVTHHLLQPMSQIDHSVQIDAGFDVLRVTHVQNILGGNVARSSGYKGAAAGAGQ